MSVIVADLNRDGIPDLAVVNQGSNDISVLLGNGDGSFQPAMNFPVGQNSQSLAVGDFNGDGIPDLATGNFNSRDVSVLLGNGDGTFQLFPVSFGVLGASSPNGMAVGDFNGDGKPDLAVGGGGVTILINDATSTTPQITAISPLPGAVPETVNRSAGAH